MSRFPKNKRFKGFTLAELLIALAILGVIATFTIPKVLQSQQDGRYNALAKEAAGTIETAYQQHKQNGLLSSSTKPSDFAPYLNYVKVITTGSIDDNQTYGTRPCDTSHYCYLLHNGAILQADVASYNGSTTLNGIFFVVDPDGKVTDGTTNGPGKSMFFLLYYNGRLATSATALPNSVNSGGTFSADPLSDPPWFSWN